MDNKENIRIILADDHSIFRAGIRAALSKKENIKIIAEAGNGIELLRLLDRLETDMILLDIRMPEMDGIEALPKILQSFPDMRIIVMTMYDDEKMILKMIENGASSYLAKSASAEEIYKAILGVYNDDFYFNDLVNNAFQNRFKQTKSSESQYAIVTQLEKAVLRLLLEDKSMDEIAESLFLSKRSVAMIINKLKSKTGYKTKAGLITYAVKNDITDANPDRS